MPSLNCFITFHYLVIFSSKREIVVWRQLYSLNNSNKHLAITAFIAACPMFYKLNSTSGNKQRLLKWEKQGKTSKQKGNSRFKQTIAVRGESLNSPTRMRELKTKEKAIMMRFQIIQKKKKIFQNSFTAFPDPSESFFYSGSPRLGQRFYHRLEQVSSTDFSSESLVGNFASQTNNMEYSLKVRLRSTNFAC